MPRPNFFIVGAPKCGTTSLHTYLSTHPDIFLSRPKEPRYFDTDLPTADDWCIRDETAYHKLFDDAGGAKAVGEASPTYLLSEVAAQRLREYDQDARIIVALRNPVDFMLSLHRQFVGSCNEDITSFAEALDAEPSRAAGRRLPPQAHTTALLEYRKNAGFSAQLERYHQQFSRDQVKVILLEDLWNQPKETYSDLLRFLGVDASWVTSFEVLNTGANKKLRNFGVRRWLKQQPGVRRLVRRLPGRVRGAVGGLLASFNNDAIDPTTAIDPSLREQLQREFEPEVERLGQMIGRDLSHWNAKG